MTAKEGTGNTALVTVLRQHRCRPCREFAARGFDLVLTARRKIDLKPWHLI